MKEYISHDDTNINKILSIFNLKTLGAQHYKTFKEKYNIELLSYEDGFKRNEHFYICINSLLKLEHLSNEDLGQYVVFIDEINSFLQFTHNETIKDLKRVYNLLLRIIKNAHKVIVCDNIICDNVFELLEVRGDVEQKFYINEYSKFEGVQARRCKNENNFLEIIKNNSYSYVSNLFQL
jgi:hypothetical protein